ncbi:uncharacterized protein LOC128961171 [Oppia nitens]|uniref:uncharacterized protein LOC128961171 n=1 Tax=Oppia nitens TaxID=1686743 RepID=UPI0023DADAA3|nr:uncharacterized protein LOC128961171 [Oppia nitens]
MPEEVFRKYKISSRNLSETDKRTFWDKFSQWWQNAFAQVGKFVQKVVKFFDNLFKNNRKTNGQQTTTTTEVPPTPSQHRYASNVVICVEKDIGGQVGLQTTKIYTIDVTTPFKIQNEWVTITSSATTTSTTTTTTTTTESTNESETNKYETMDEQFSTPFDPNRERNPVMVGVGDQKVRHDSHRDDPTVVKAI